MKAMVKKIGIMLIAGVLSCVCLVGCGAISIDDIKGDWTADTINGQAVADYAASLGVPTEAAVTNWTIKDDKTLTSSNVTGTIEFDMDLKSNGFELKQKGQSDVFASVKYDKDAGTLTFAMKNSDGSTLTYVMKKGTGNIEAAPADDASEAEEPAEDDSEVAEEEVDDSEDEATEDEAAEDETAEDEESEEEEE